MFPLRTKSGSPNDRSNSLMCFEIAGCEMLSIAAVLVKLRVRATVTKTLSLKSVIIVNVSLVYIYFIGFVGSIGFVGLYTIQWYNNIKLIIIANIAIIAKIYYFNLFSNFYSHCTCK